MYVYTVCCRSRALLGEPGKDVEIEVPPGVTINSDSKQLLGKWR